MLSKRTDMHFISDEITDYYFDCRDDAGFRFSREWIDECIDERCTYYEIDAAKKSELSEITHSFFKQYFKRYNKTHSQVAKYLGE